MLSVAESHTPVYFNTESLLLGASLVLQRLAICLQRRRPRFPPSVGKTPWRRAWQPTAGFLPGQSHGQRSLVGYSPWGCKETQLSD